MPTLTESEQWTISEPESAFIRGLLSVAPESERGRIEALLEKLLGTRTDRLPILGQRYLVYLGLGRGLMKVEEALAKGLPMPVMKVAAFSSYVEAQEFRPGGHYQELAELATLAGIRVRVPGVSVIEILDEGVSCLLRLAKNFVPRVVGAASRTVEGAVSHARGITEVLAKAVDAEKDKDAARAVEKLREGERDAIEYLEKIAAKRTAAAWRIVLDLCIGAVEMAGAIREQIG